jgi:hypothetical protein
MISYQQRRRNTMTALSLNNDFATCELSIEELEAIAAGFSLGGALHWIGSEIGKGIDWLEHNPTGQHVASVGGSLLIRGLISLL